MLSILKSQLLSFMSMESLTLLRLLCVLSYRSTIQTHLWNKKPSTFEVNCILSVALNAAQRLDLSQRGTALYRLVCVFPKGSFKQEPAYFQFPFLIITCCKLESCRIMSISWEQVNCKLLTLQEFLCPLRAGKHCKRKKFLALSFACAIIPLCKLQLGKVCDFLLIGSKDNGVEK